MLGLPEQLGGSGSGRQPTPTLNQSTIQAEDLRTTLSIAEKNGMRVILAPDAEAFDPATALGAKNGTVMGYGPALSLMRMTKPSSQNSRYRVISQGLPGSMVSRS